MALPPLNAPSAAPAPGDMPPAGEAPAAQPEVFATILRTPDGKFLLVDGDEPEGGEMGAGEPGMMDQAGIDGPALLKQLMAKIEGGNGAEEGFAAGFKGEPGAEKPPMTRAAPGM